MRTVTDGGLIRGVVEKMSTKNHVLTEKICLSVFFLLFFFFEKKCEGNLVFSAQKMLKMFIVAAVCVMACLPCEEKLWRGKSIWCCQNGTKLEVQGKVVWSARIPPMCIKKQLMEKKEERDTAKMVIKTALFLLGSVIGCVCCGCLWRKRRNRQN